MDLQKLKGMLDGNPRETANKPAWRQTVRSTLEESRQTLGLNLSGNNTLMSNGGASNNNIYKKKFADIDLSLINFMPEIKTDEELEELVKQKKLIRHQKALDMISHKMQHSLKAVKQAKENKNNVTAMLMNMTSMPPPKSGTQASLLPISFSDTLFMSPNIKMEKEFEQVTLNLCKTKTDKQDTLSYGLVILNEEIKKDEGLTNASYYQFKICTSSEANPVVYIGVTTNDFNIKQPLQRQDMVWCLNLSSGDVLNNKKWKTYYDIDEDEDGNTTYNSTYWKDQSNTQDKTNTNERGFKQGTVVGVLVD